MPSLTILAGPNGAGKSRSTDLLLAVDLLPSFPVDLDLLVNQAIDDLPHSFYGAETRLLKGVDNLFKKYCEEAIREQRDFTYECNFRKDQLKYVGLFEEAGYEINLIYFLLNSIEQSKERVDYRVKHQNGRSVDILSIRENFIQGLANLDNHYQDFNRVIIVDNSEDNYENKDHSLNIQLDINGKLVSCFNDNFPSEPLRQYLPRLIELVSLIKE